MDTPPSETLKIKFNIQSLGTLFKSTPSTASVSQITSSSPPSPSTTQHSNTNHNTQQSSTQNTNTTSNIYDPFPPIGTIGVEEISNLFKVVDILSVFSDSELRVVIRNIDGIQVVFVGGFNQRARRFINMDKVTEYLPHHLLACLVREEDPYWLNYINKGISLLLSLHLLDPNYPSFQRIHHTYTYRSALIDLILYSNIVNMHHLAITAPGGDSGIFNYEDNVNIEYKEDTKEEKQPNIDNNNINNNNNSNNDSVHSVQKPTKETSETQDSSSIKGKRSKNRALETVYKNGKKIGKRIRMIESPEQTNVTDSDSEISEEIEVVKPKRKTQKHKKIEEDIQQMELSDKEDFDQKHEIPKKNQESGPSTTTTTSTTTSTSTTISTLSSVKDFANDELGVSCRGISWDSLRLSFAVMSIYLYKDVERGDSSGYEAYNMLVAHPKIDTFISVIIDALTMLLRDYHRCGQQERTARSLASILESLSFMFVGEDFAALLLMNSQFISGEFLHCMSSILKYPFPLEHGYVTYHILKALHTLFERENPYSVDYLYEPDMCANATILVSNIIKIANKAVLNNKISPNPTSPLGACQEAFRIMELLSDDSNAKRDVITFGTPTLLSILSFPHERIKYLFTDPSVPPPYNLPFKPPGDVFQIPTSPSYERDLIVQVFRIVGNLHCFNAAVSQSGDKNRLIIALHTIIQQDLGISKQSFIHNITQNLNFILQILTEEAKIYVINYEEIDLFATFSKELQMKLKTIEVDSHPQKRRSHRDEE